MPTASSSRLPSVCLFSGHPLVLPEMVRLLEGQGFRIQSRRLDPVRATERKALSIPRATVYVLDSQPRRSATEALATRILYAHPGARLVVLAEKFGETDAFPLLRIGTKGLLTYGEAFQHLARALQEVANGGYWVPRSLLSSFVESAISVSPSRPLASRAVDLTPREQEVLTSLLENCSNKEIARRLHISERTAKFHVSNLLAKHGVKRRADLILLTLTR